LHAVERLHQPEAAASLAYGTFAVLMTVGRLTVDRVAHRFGPRFVVRFGSLTAAVGIGLVVISPVYPLTVLGWAIYGVGLAGIVPQLFTAAGNLPSVRPSVVLARVVGAGYVGMLAGPALIGAAASSFGLGNAFIIPLVFCLVGVALAGSVSAKPTSDRVSSAAIDR
jgi:MFS family permease